MDVDNEKRYPNTYRTWSAAQFADAAITFLSQMNWYEIAIISDSVSYSFQTLQRFLTLAPGNNITAGVIEVFVTDPTEALNRIKETELRIFISFCYQDACPKIACAVSSELINQRFTFQC